jgi:ATP-binding cassette subfamily F protein uup
VSTYLSAENLGHSFHDHWLFRNLTVGINRGRRVALVGINGAGKSTLLKLLSEQFLPMEGKVVHSKDVQIGYLDQDPKFEKEATISDFIFSADNEQQQLIRRYEELLTHDPDNHKAIDKVMEQLSETNAWEYEYQIKNILGRLDVHDLQQKISTLSGGQKKRLSLAKLLIAEPEVYVLDEPTNHLDIDTIEWLEKLLTEGNKTILMVTHDRYFLDNVCNEIIELDRGKVFSYQGNYGYFLEKKAERQATLDVQFQRNSNLLKKELEWMRRQPQARGTKSQSRINAFYDLEEKTKNAGPNAKVELSIKTARQGSKILELHHLTKSFEQKQIIDNFNYVFKKGDRIGLAGKNGSGKSTLLNLITGAIQPDNGEVIKGETTVIGYFHQGGMTFSPNERVIEVVKNVAEYITMADGKQISASQLLTQFLFPPAKQHGMVANLSGGEKKRLQLMSILIKNPNFLILDEPTNDLDIDTLNVLEEFLLSYNGVLMLVSHDRYLLDRLTDQLFIMEGTGEVTLFNGNYSSYKDEQEYVKAQQKLGNVITKTAVLDVITVKKNKLNFKELKELENLDTDIQKLEQEIKDLTFKLNTEQGTYQQIADLSKQIKDLSNALDEKSIRWIELTELNEA